MAGWGERVGAWAVDYALVVVGCWLVRARSDCWLAIDTPGVRDDSHAWCLL